MHTRFLTRQVVSRGVLLVALALVLYVVLPQFGGLEQSWRVLRHANVSFLLIAAVCMATTYGISTVQYQWLTLKRIPYVPTLLVQVACGLAGKLLPAGLGSLGLNAAYLRKQKHTITQAATVVSVNNILGFGGYLILLALALLAHDVQRPLFSLPGEAVLLVSTGVIVAAGTAALIFRGQISTWLARTVKNVRDSLRTYHAHPWRIIGVVLLAVFVPLLFTAILWCSARAVGTTLGFATAFAVFSAGLIVGTVTPTPGGIVGAEAGLTGALIAYGLPAQQALIVALLYRFMTYWLPMLPGAVALIFARRRYV